MGEQGLSGSQGGLEWGGGAVVSTWKQLSQRMAALARTVRDRIRTALALEAGSGPLTQLLRACRTTLVHHLDGAGFADMYAQTITYGLLSARITDPTRPTTATLTAHLRTHPFLKELVEVDCAASGISQVVDLLDQVDVAAVIRDFGVRNPQEDPAIHFYEHFLTAYNKTRKVRRGVFYTPGPVVSAMVAAVDRLLRTEFGLSRGLADTTTWGAMAKRHAGLRIPNGTPPYQAFVQILDPATGTGTFLVETIDLIHKTMVNAWREQGHGEAAVKARWNAYVPKHLLPRLHGYELLMAPYAIAHFKISLKLHETGYLFQQNERARVYLTNGLKLPDDDEDRLTCDGQAALARETQAANHVKQHQRFTVVIGNPPYAGHSQNNQLAWIVEKVHDYRRGVPELSKPAQAKWLQDDYVKFIRFSEEKIINSGYGLLGLITNHGYLDNITFRGMRGHLLSTFSSLRVLDLHGNTKKRETAPDGSPDENVFDIQQGVAILLASRTWGKGRSVVFDELFGFRSHKRKALSAKLAAMEDWQPLIPRPGLLMLRPENSRRRREYETFIPLPAVMGVNGDPAPGIVTTHDDFAISWSPQDVIAKVEEFLETGSEAEARGRFRLCAQAQWNYTRAKTELQRSNWQNAMDVIAYRPFDRRWTVYNRHVAVHQRLRVTRHFRGHPNIGLCVGKAGQVVGAGAWNLISCTRHPVDLNYFYRGGACVFPLYLTSENNGEDAAVMPNGYSKINMDNGFPHGGGIKTTPEAVLGFIYAILHAPNYRSRYAEFLKVDFPRVPSTANPKLFTALARLGGDLMALHLLESPDVHPLITTYVGPPTIQVGRVGWLDGAVWLDAGKGGTRQGHRAKCPGTVGFHGVPENVWDFHVGGYQVCYKWLKDRKGRTLSEEDILHYQKIIVALNKTIHVVSRIDEVIGAHGGWPDAFQVVSGADGGAAPLAKFGSGIRRRGSSPMG
ncbi:MAG: hypothetical protein F4Z75_04935 [Synechococcus sp. SB0668_bin_15]|nr:hypothetical protein [Synechococcus sp. SB0668_bin_15]MYC48958.1 hypothetical protein [Synechococcus sp. SB0662_bin_14]